MNFKMNKILMLLALVAFGTKLQAQKSFQVFETTSADAKWDGKQFTTENDTLKASYYFWSEKGIFAVTIQNKLKTPLFIDWEQSSFKSLGQKFDYWPDNEAGKPSPERVPYLYNGPSPLPNSMAEKVGGAGANKNRTPRVTEIKPGGSVIRYQYYIFPKNYFDMGAKATSLLLPLKENNDITTQAYEISYSEKNTPLRFFNSLVYSGTSEFKGKGEISESFYLKKVVELETRQFKANSAQSLEEAKKDGSPYYATNNFFVPVPAGKGAKK